MANYIIIDDNPVFAKGLGERLKTFKIIDAADGKSPANIAALLNDDSEDAYSINEIKPHHRRIKWKTRTEEETIILINAEGFYNSDNREELPGVEILIWLRCKYYIVNPIILYGFQTTAFILQNHPEHLIIHSEGCLYLRLPFRPEQILKMNIQEVSVISALRKHLIGAFNMEVFRHSFANKWGISRLKIAYNIINSNNSSLPNEIDNKEILIAKFIYVSEKFKDTIDTSLLNNIRLNTKHYHSYICNKKILYIDDQATAGWSDMLRNALNLTKDNFNVFNFFPDDINLLVKLILDRIQNFQPDCVLLDLRLRPGDEFLKFGEQYTGALVAEKIKDKYVALPVIMFTASNKAENLRVAIRIGCETLWTKEGIDEYKGINYSLQNYFRLVKSVYNACKKFEMPTAKVNYATDKLLEGIEKRIHRTNYNFLKNEINGVGIFENFDLVIPDTNLFIQNDEKLIPDHVSNIFILLHLCKMIGNTKFHLNDEVFIELLRHSKKPIDKNRDGIENIKIERARYIISKIFYWQSKKLIVFGIPDIQNYGGKMRTFSEDSIVQRDSFDNIDEVFQSPKYLSDVNADKVLVEFIPDQIKKGKRVLLITEDNGCACHVGKVLEELGLSVTHKSNKKISEFNQKRDINEKVEDINGSVVYMRMDLADFHSILNNVRNKIMEIKLEE